MMLNRLWAALVVVAALIAPATAQDLPRTPVLTIESDRLYADSAFGRQVAAAIEAEGAALTTENRQIEAELTAEEQSLTDQRATLPAEEFRALADSFDARVIQLRREQDAKVRALGLRSDEARRQFLVAVQPVLEQLMRETGAVVIIERRNVVLDVSSVNITDVAIARIDAAMGPQVVP